MSHKHFTGIGGIQETECDFINGAADIFAPIPTEKSTTFSRESIHRPLNENSQGPFEFNLPAEGDTYVDPDQFRLSGYTSLVKIDENGEEKELAASDDVAPISFAPGMAFQTKELSLQGKLVNYATQPLDNLKSYIENLLSYGTDPKATVLKTCCNWIPDKPGQADTCTGEGYLARKALWAKSKKVPFCIPLQVDVLSTERFLPRSLDIHLKLTKVNDAFLYTAKEGGNYRLLFHQMKLHTRRVTMQPAIVNEHEKSFKNNYAIYPFSRTDIKFINIPVGTSIARSDNIYRHKIPNSALVFFVDASALAGNPKKNPQNFQHFDVNKLVCKINSEEIPSGGYTQNYETNDFALTYRRFFDNIGIRTNNIGNDISAEAYKEGCNIYAFDMTPDSCNGFHDHIPLRGNIEFEVMFSKVTTLQISMVILSQYDDQLLLDGTRNVANRGEPTAI